jgi:hypothetical protein
MTSTIKVDNIQNQCGANIINESSNTITIGASGDTVTLASGASQSGFGRTGSVDWQTSIKTADFTAVNGEGYFINTTSGAVTMTLPSSPSVGDIVAIKDYANTFDTNNLTINRNGQPVSGDAVNPIITTEGQALTLVYGDSTKGWQSIAASTETDLPKAAFVTATGGTITTVCTNFKVHTFTGPGTFTVTCAGNAAGSNTVDYLVVAGGGAGGGAAGYSGTAAGGGGAGGYRESGGTASGCYAVSPLGSSPSPVAALPVTAQGYPITVGGGGSTGGGCSQGGDGNNSVFSTITSAGGGGGGGAPAPNNAGRNGGSGGGSSCAPGSPNVGTGNTPPVNPPQGNPGGVFPSTSFGSGGGGATTAGFGTPQVGGTGATSSINATPTARAGGGGGGGAGPPAPQQTGGAGGSGGGGTGAPSPGGCHSSAGTANTGGGGGGGPVADGTIGGAGGSGIVIIRYKFQ